jgi:hypothetical protein
MTEVSAASDNENPNSVTRLRPQRMPPPLLHAIDVSKRFGSELVLDSV